MKRRVWILLALLLACALPAGCAASPERRIGRALGVSLPASTAVSYTDDHGGFHGDGTVVATLVFSEADGAALAAALAEAPGWRPLPLTENVRRLFDGCLPDGAGERPLAVTDGWWYVLDRHSQSDDPFSDAALFDRYSFNVTVAVYDRAANILYYFELDT